MASVLLGHTLLGGFLIHLALAKLMFPDTLGGPSYLTYYLVPLTWLVFQVSLLGGVDQSKALQLLWLAVMVITEVLHYVAFLASHLLIFFVAYEAVLIPLQVLIAQWGSGSSRLRASLLFFMYTYLSSVPMLISVLYLASFALSGLGPQAAIFVDSCASWGEVMALWLNFGLSFAVKTPLFPFFLWLLFAHAEAPVEGSMILAGVVLKLATFGVANLLLLMLWGGSVQATISGMALSAFSLLMASTSLVQQVDVKSFVALTSVAHIGNGTMGMLSLSEEGVLGSLYMALAHGVVSPALFLITGGVLYGTFGSRLVYAYRGLMVVLPSMSAIFFILLLGNIAVPMSPNWIAELMILAGLAASSLANCLFSALNILLGAVYTLWLTSRTVFGVWSLHLRSSGDLSFTDHFSCAILTSQALLLGLCAHRSIQLLGAGLWTLI